MGEKQVLEEFWTFCLSTGSERRLKKIKNIINKSREVIGKDLTKLKVDDVVKFLAWINQSDYKAYTKNDYKKIFKRFLKWKYNEINMIEGPKVKEAFKGVSKKRAFNKEKINKSTFITPEEFEKLIRAAQSLKWKALISLLYESAFRPCEVRVLRWENLKFSDQENICRITVKSPKTEDTRTIPVKDCVLHLKRWKEEYQFSDRTEKDFVFPAQHHREKPLGDGVVSEMFKRLCKKAEIRHIFPYMLRHARIYEIQKRLGARIAAKYAGHTLETSEIYDHLDDDDVEESMLKNVYTTKELTKDERTKLEKEVDDLIKWKKEATKYLKHFRDVEKERKDFLNKAAPIPKRK